MTIKVTACNVQSGIEWRFQIPGIGRQILTAYELTGDCEGSWSRAASRRAKAKLSAIYGIPRSLIRFDIALA